MEEVIEIKGLVLASILFFFMVPEASIESQDVTEQRGGKEVADCLQRLRAQCPRSVWRKKFGRNDKVPSMAMGREKET